MSEQTPSEKFLSSVITPLQGAEDASHQIKVGFTVDDAVGNQLTIVGKWVGRGRNGVTDDEVFRRYVRAQIIANRSDGIIEDVIAISDLVVYDAGAVYVLDNHGRAACTLRVEDVIVDAAVHGILASFLRKAVSGGVRITIEVWPALEADMFVFGDVTADPPGKGWGDVTDPAVGGVFASALE